MMNTKFVLRRSVVVLAFAFALGSSALSTNAFAAGGVLERGRVVTHANAHRSDRVGRSGHEWDPWGHWGAYYGPMVHVDVTGVMRRVKVLSVMHVTAQRNALA